MNRKLLDLPEPLYIAHRGGANVYPEHSMIAYKFCVEDGIQLIEQDCHGLNDGSIAIMHDASVDRTTTSSGLVTAQDASSWKDLKIDAGRLLTSAWSNPDAPLLEEVFATFGKSVCYVPEIKNSNCKKMMVDLIIKYGLEDYCLVQSFDINDLGDTLRAGIAAIALGEWQDPQKVASAGIKYVGLSASVSDDRLLSFLSADLKIIIYSVNHRYERDQWLRKGVSGFFSDDPLWLSGKAKKLRADPFETGRYYHGHLASTPDRGDYLLGRWGYPKAVAGKNYCLQGWACPLTAASYSIEITMTFDELLADECQGALLAFCTLRDHFSEGNGDDGYLLSAGANGELVLNVVIDGLITELSRMKTEAILQGDSATLKIELTPKTLTVIRADDAENRTICVQHSDYRGAYFHLGRHVAGVTFSKLRICESKLG